MENFGKLGRWRSDEAIHLCNLRGNNVDIRECFLGSPLACTRTSILGKWYHRAWAVSGSHQGLFWGKNRWSLFRVLWIELAVGRQRRWIRGLNGVSCHETSPYYIWNIQGQQLIWVPVLQLLYLRHSEHFLEVLKINN